MGKISIKEFDRIKNVLLSDKINTPSRLNDAIKSDIIAVLSNYLEIRNGTFVVDIRPNESGYSLKITGEGDRLRSRFCEGCS